MTARLRKASALRARLTFTRCEGPQALRREGAALSPLFFLELDHGTVVAPVIVFARHG